ncbi:MAG: hypothetical protein ACRDZ3_20850 [Acidimicrobiia bacterium]
MATKKTAKPRRARNIADVSDEDAFRPPTAAERKRLDADAARPYKESYEAGRRDAQRQARAKTTGRRPAAGKRRGSPAARRAARQLQAPIQAQVTSGLRILGLTLAVVALYSVLNNAGAVSGVLGGFARAVDWLGSARAIPSR